MIKVMKRIFAVYKTCGNERKCWLPTYKHFKGKELKGGEENDE